MAENKTEQYTFGPEEKEILAILALFERGLGEDSKETNRQIKYYNNFTFNGKSIDGFKNIFIVIEKDEKGKKESRLKGISENATLEEMEQALKGKDDNQENKDEQENSSEQEMQEQDEEAQKIEVQSQGKKLRISKYRKISDSNISERMPEVFQDGIESGIAFSNELNRFVIISKVGDHYQVNGNAEQARMTWETVISIDPDGKKVERKVPYALMQLPNNSQKEIAVTLDPYGDPSIETVDVLSAQKRIGMQAEMEGDPHRNPDEVNDVNYTLATEGNQLPEEMASIMEILKNEYGVTEIDFEELKDLDKDTLEALMEEEADRVKISKAGFEGYVKKADGKTLKEKINNAQQEIVDEYIGKKRPR